MEQIIDPVFGLLTFRTGVGAVDWWEKREPSKLIGAPVLLEIYAGSSGPTEEQRQVYLTLKQAEDSLRAELQEALYEFYKIEREAYADVCSDIEGYVEECLPLLQKSEETWGILTPLFWLIMGPETADVQAGEAGEKYDARLSWHGCWDVEHEFSALFRGGRFLGIDALGSFYDRLDLKPSQE